MGILTFASDETKRLELEGGDWLDVRKDMSKRTFNRLMSAMPSREISEESGLTIEEGTKFAESLFEALVVDWSAPGDVSVDNYLNLSREAAQAVDAALIDHFGEISPSPDEESKVSTSRGSTRRGNARTR